MINYTQIKNDILVSLRDHLRDEYEDLLVIEQDPNAREPESRLYLTMHFTSPFISEGYQGILETELVDHPDPAWDYDIQYTRYSNDTMSCSFTIYGQNPNQAVQVGLMAQGYFKFIGLDNLRSKGIVVVECMELQNRDTYVVDSWERRQGFDVVFRVLGEVQRIVPTIESADIERK